MNTKLYLCHNKISHVKSSLIVVKKTKKIKFGAHAHIQLEYLDTDRYYNMTLMLMDDTKACD